MKVQLVKVWKTLSGEEIKISNMTDEHLGNTLRMLKRNGVGRFHLCAGTDMISDPCMDCMTPDPTTEALEDEAKRRGLNWET